MKCSWSRDVSPPNPSHCEASPLQVYSQKVQVMQNLLIATAMKLHWFLLQVHLRLQWVRQLVRGQYMNAEIDMAGVGVIFMGGLQDELFNLTLDRLKVSYLHSTSFCLMLLILLISLIMQNLMHQSATLRIESAQDVWAICLIHTWCWKC